MLSLAHSSFTHHLCRMSATTTIDFFFPHHHCLLLRLLSLFVTSLWLQLHLNPIHLRPLPLFHRYRHVLMGLSPGSEVIVYGHGGLFETANCFGCFRMTARLTSCCCKMQVLKQTQYHLLYGSLNCNIIFSKRPKVIM